MSLSPCFIDSLYFARASSEITEASAFIKSVSHAAAIAIACGNIVAVPALASPCKPSFHQL